MIDIKSEILERLHCSKCNEYLSYAPIMITRHGENLCGRCVKENPNNTFIRNRVYEHVVSEAAFPCRYKDEGCDVIMLWDDVINHEDHCERRQIKCPVAPNVICKWEGRENELLEHYQEIHPDLILEHPCSLDIDITVDTDKNMLLSFLGFLFLIQIRCNTNLSKLWHAVQCFADPLPVLQFSFSVQFNSDKGSFKKEERISAVKCYKMQTYNCIETNINSLTGLLGGCKNIKCVLSILPKVDAELQGYSVCEDEDCYNSKLYAVYKYNDNYYCSDCKKENSFHDKYLEQILSSKVLKACKNNLAGCPYFNTDNKLIKRHETLRCKWQQNCVLGCELEFGKLQNHTHKSVLSTRHDIDIWNNGQFTHNNNIIHFKFFMSKTEFKALLCTRLIEDIHLYKCVFKFCYAGNLTFKYTQTDQNDWEIHHIFSGNNPHIDFTWNYYKFNDIVISKDE